MVRAADIKDRDSLETWLKDQPREVAVAIASRAALRVIPVWAAYCQTEAARERDLTPLPILRANLVSSVSAVLPTDEVVHAADTAARADATDVAATTAATAAATAAAAADARAAAAADARAMTARAAAAAQAAAAAAHAGATDVEAADAARAAADARGMTARAAAVLAAQPEAGVAVRSDAQAFDAGASIPDGPLWPDRNPLAGIWASVRADWSRPGSPYAFWLRWYDHLLDPDTHPAIPPDVLYQIALIPDDTWTAGPDAVAKAIANIEAEFDALEDEFDKSVAAMPPASPDRVQATKQAMERHRADLPPTFDAILGYIALEVERLQTRNYRDADDEDDAKRQIKTLTTLYRAIEQLQALVPKTDEMPVEDAEKAEKLGRLYLNKFKEWPREHVDDVVGGVYAMGGEIAGNTIRMGLVAATAFALPMIGVPTQWALGAGVAVFGNKTIAEAAKSVRDSVFPSKP